MLAVLAFDFRFLTDTPNPLVTAGRGVTRLPSFPAVESPRIHIVSPAEKRTKDPDLGVGAGVLMNVTRFQKHGSYS